MKFKSYLLFFLLFGVLPDTYFCVFCMSGLAGIWKLLLCLPTIAALVYLVRIRKALRYTESLRIYSYIIFMAEFPKFVAMLFSLLFRALGIGPADLVAACIGGCTAVFFAIMIFLVTTSLKVNELTLSFGELPAGFDGLRVCHIADFHLGSFGEGNKYIGRIVDTVCAQKPDIILFAGDLVNFDSAEADSYLDVLSRLQAPLGVYAVRGNHDYLLHGHFSEEERLEDLQRLLDKERSLGWKLLLNDNVLLQKDGACIAVAGVENISGNPYFPDMGGDLSKALEGIPEGTFTILLSHDPSHWRAGVIPDGRASLTLSGHTHGLKFKLAGMHLSSWHLRESRGVYTQGRQVLHVTAGLGSAFAFRLGGAPRIDMITLKSI